MAPHSTPDTHAGLLLALGWKPQHRSHISTTRVLHLNGRSQPGQPRLGGSLAVKHQHLSPFRSSHLTNTGKKSPSKMPFKKEAVLKEFSIFAIFFLVVFFLNYFLRKLTTNFYVVFRIACSAQFWQRNSGNCREMKLEIEVKLTIAAKRFP